MHVVSFYSFKGGTGRTMAMVNVAVELGIQGNNVLMVDFDLEAPGLDTFSGVAAPAGTKGIVDFVTDYLAIGKVPDVREYVYQPELAQGLPGKLWVMPAGLQDEGYDERFKSIDWKYLYDEQDGFLLFEDLKEQWKEALGVNYVLLDSRTGHTDIGGICTRQLPDAVAIFFFPNEQNRRGLKSMVEGIRAEAVGPLMKVIKTHFVMANVPDLDDEEEILAANVERLHNTLKYDELAAVIHHYNSLLLLDQNVFALLRPRSRLAHEYRQLTKTIRRANMEDRVGALEFLEEVGRKLRSRRPPVPADVDGPLQEILEKHPNDGEILRQLARLRRRQRKWSEALALLDQAISLGVVDADILLTRAELYWSLGNRNSALSDVYRLISRSDASYFDLQPAVRLLIELRGDVDIVLSSPSIKSLELPGQLAIARELDSEVETLATSEKLMRRLRAEHPDVSSAIGTELTLCLIGQGKFKEAMSEISPHRPDVAGLDIYDAFNYAMAEWADTRTVPKDLFARVVALDTGKSRPGPNYHQCAAIAYWAIGDLDRAFEQSKKAYEWIGRGSAETFSCWSYLWVDAPKFFADVTEMDRMFNGGDATPTYMTRAGINLGSQLPAAETLR
jgi:MinD-like ATPase involved in chromosome partitioning or flagellar assembly